MTEQGEPAALGNKLQNELRVANWNSALTENALFDANEALEQAEAARDGAAVDASERDIDREEITKEVLYKLSNASEDGEVSPLQAFEIAQHLAEEIRDQEFGAKLPEVLAFAETLTPGQYVVLHEQVYVIAEPPEGKPGVFPAFELERGANSTNVKVGFALPLQDQVGGMHGYYVSADEGGPVIGDATVVADYLAGVLARGETRQVAHDFDKKRNIGDNFAFVENGEWAKRCYDEANGLAVQTINRTVAEIYDPNSRTIALDAMRFLLENAPDVADKLFDGQAIVFAEKNGFPTDPFVIRPDIKFAQLYALATAVGGEGDGQFADHKMDVLINLHTRGKELLAQKSVETTQE